MGSRKSEILISSKEKCFRDQMSIKHLKTDRAVGRGGLCHKICHDNGTSAGMLFPHKLPKMNATIMVSHCLLR